MIASRHLVRGVVEVGRAVRELLFPECCPVCGAATPGLCRPCRAVLEVRPAHGCRRCGEAVPPGASRCGDAHRPFAHIDRFVAPFRYRGSGGALVRRLKLDGDAIAGQFLVGAMARAWQRGADRSWRRGVWVAVPTHASRRRRRGFDQAEWMAAQLAARLGQQHLPGALLRSRATLPQGDPRVGDRAANVDGAFRVARPAVVAGRDVVLVDDVFTSGATARSCAACLVAAGASRVAVLTACRS